MNSTGSIHRIRRIDLRGAAADSAGPVDYRAAVPRAEFDVEAAVHVVRPICDDVRDRGVEAIREFGAKFDGVDRADIAVPPEAMAEALADLDPGVRAGLEESIRRLRVTCEAELEHDVVTDLGPGARVTHRMVPVERVGLYVPGGLAPLVSSVVMNVVPAQVAGVALDRADLLAAEGVRRPAAPDDPRRVRAARRRRGLRRRVARRRSPCSRTAPARAGAVDLVTGPGNIYMVAAKRLLKGVVGIDSEAGPTEIADPRRRHRRRRVRRRRPDQPGRARPAGREPCWSRPRRRSPTRSRPSWTSRCR